MGGGNKIKSATKVYEDYTQGKTTHTFTAQKGKAYVITICELHGTSEVTAIFTGCEVLCNNKLFFNTNNYPTTLSAVVVATGASVTIKISGGIDYQWTMIHELN